MVFVQQGMKICKIETMGWKNAITGMRYPMNSELQSDSLVDSSILVKLGDKDLDLMKRLAKAGTDHSKFLRMIHVSASVRMPFSWWKQFDTYKIATTAISRSTMHRGVGKELLTRDDFYTEQWREENQYILDKINDIQQQILKAEQDKNIKLKKQLWRRLMDVLPLTLCQERMIDFNYQVLLNILGSRFQVEKLSQEWDFFCNAFLTCCPYLKEFYDTTKHKRSLTTEEFKKL